jgi:tetratricopeptide (TPR) repeat protein
MPRKLAVCLLVASGCGAPLEAPRPAAPPPVPVAAASGEEPGEEVASVVSHLTEGSPRREIGALEGVLAATPRTSPERPRILWRLAEDYAAIEAARRDRGAEGAAAAQAARRKAIELYAELAAEHPAFCAGEGRGCGDEVLYRLAREHEEDGAPDEARRAYREIIKGWPLSRHVPDAYFAFAQAFLEASSRDPSRLAMAEQAYKEVLRFPPADNRLAAHAHYQIAIVHHRRGDPAPAIAHMVQAIEVAEANPNQTAGVAEEARRELVSIYAGGGDPGQAYDLLAAHSGDRPGASERLQGALEALVSAYSRAGKPEEAVELAVDWLSRGAGSKTCAVVRTIDAVLEDAARRGRSRAKMLSTAAASAPLMKARVECASAAAP